MKERARHRVEPDQMRREAELVAQNLTKDRNFSGFRLSELQQIARCYRYWKFSKEPQKWLDR